jgi:hypothetical protein
MKTWQFQEAKAKLTRLINEAKFEPQIISRHGVDETVVLNIEKYKELIGKDEDLVSFFRKSPLYNLELEFERDRSKMRKVDL